jgi:hypothetical protein
VADSPISGPLPPLSHLSPTSAQARAAPVRLISRLYDQTSRVVSRIGMACGFGFLFPTRDNPDSDVVEKKVVDEQRA